MMLFQILLFTLPLFVSSLQESSPADDMKGAWEAKMSDGTTALWIITDKHFSITSYNNDPPRFISTQGGHWNVVGDRMELFWEYHTQQKELTGQQKTETYELEDNTLTVNNVVWKRIDDGTPGQLNGAWLITGRMVDGKMNTLTPGARKTMKILSGTRFQWIAYNSETGDFFGTGGGSYSTSDGKYIENIEFFSRDNSRVGAALEFNFDIKDGAWHHSGHSSKGDPLYEIWSKRASLGI